MMNALQISPAWKKHYSNPTKARLGTINAMMPTGKIMGFLFVAPFSNHFGRKISLVLAFIIAVIGTGIQAGAVNFGMLVFSRLLLGFGCVVMSQPSPILLAELAYPTHRGKITSLYHCFYVSSLFSCKEKKILLIHRLVRWVNRRRLDHVRYSEDEWIMELENSHSSPRCRSSHTTPVLLVSSGISEVNISLKLFPPS